MKLFDEDGNFVGEFIEASKEVVDDTVEHISDAFAVSIWFGILCFAIAPWLGILYIILLLVFKILFAIIKLLFRILWWILRLIFSLIFRKNFPRF